MLKPSSFDPKFFGCPKCDWPLNPADDMGDGGVTCACGGWTPLPNPPRPEPIRYTFFYPESGQRFSFVLEFDTPEEAIQYWEDKRSGWTQIPAAGRKDKAAFMSPSSGEIVVVRPI